MNPVLFGAEKMLVAMGYQPVPGREAEVLSLAPAAVGQHPVNIDMVTSVARDCLLAGVECRLLADVHAAVSAQFPTTTAEEVIEFRRDHIGSMDVCSRELLYRKQQLAALPSPQYGLQSCRFPGPERRPSGDQDEERDRDKECGENRARPSREHHKESRGGRLEPMDTSDPATQMTNNYDMPILSESPQLSPSLSPVLKPIDTVHPAELLPQKFVSEEADSTTNNVISIPDTDDMANIAIISESLKLLDAMDSKFSSAQTSGPAAASVDLAASSPKLDKYMGRPEKPPSSAYSLFSKEMLNTEAIKQFPSKERMSHISEAWKQVVRGSVNVLD